MLSLGLYFILLQRQWRFQRLIWAHREREARVWENQLGVCKPPPVGTAQSPVGGRGAKSPENFDDLLVKNNLFMKREMFATKIFTNKA